MPNIRQIGESGISAGLAYLATSNPYSAALVGGLRLLQGLFGGEEPSTPPPRHRGYQRKEEYKRYFFGYGKCPGWLMWENALHLQQVEVPLEWYVDKDDRGVSVLDNVIYLCHGKITHLEGLYLNNRYVTLASSAGSTYPQNDPVYVPRTAADGHETYRGKLALQPSFARPSLPRILGDHADKIKLDQAYVDKPPPWRPDYHKSDISYARLSLMSQIRGQDYWKDNEYPARVDFLCYGVPVYDLSAYPNHLTAPKVWTNNCISIRYFVEREILGVADEYIDFAALLESYNYADVLVDNDFNQVNSDGSNVFSGNDISDYDRFPARSRRYSFDGLVTTEDADIDRLRQRFNFQCNGRTVPVGGKIAILCGKDRAPVSVAVRNNDWISQPVRVAQPPITERFNALRVRYTSQAANFEETEISVEDTPAVERDGRVIYRQGVLEIADCNDDVAVRRKAVTELVAVREPEVIEGEILGLLPDADVGDVMGVFCTELGINGRLGDLYFVDRDPVQNKTKVTFLMLKGVFTDRVVPPPLLKATLLTGRALQTIVAGDDGNDGLDGLPGVDGLPGTAGVPGWPGFNAYNHRFFFDRAYWDAPGPPSAGYSRSDIATWFMRLAKNDFPYWGLKANPDVAYDPATQYAVEFYHYIGKTAPICPAVVATYSDNQPPIGGGWVAGGWPSDDEWPADWRTDPTNNLYVIRRTRTGNNYGYWESINSSYRRRQQTPGQPVTGGIWTVVHQAKPTWKLLQNMQYSGFRTAPQGLRGNFVRRATVPLEVGDFISVYFSETLALVFSVRTKPRPFASSLGLQQFNLLYDHVHSRADMPLTHDELAVANFELRFYSNIKNRPNISTGIPYDTYFTEANRATVPLDSNGAWQAFTTVNGVDFELGSRWQDLLRAEGVKFAYTDADDKDQQLFLKKLSGGEFRIIAEEYQWLEWTIESVEQGTEHQNFITLRFEADSQDALQTGPVTIQMANHRVELGFSQSAPGEPGAAGEDGRGTEYRFTINATKTIDDATKLLPRTEPYDPPDPSNYNGQIWTDGADQEPTSDLPYELRVHRWVPGTPDSGEIPKDDWGEWSTPTVVGEYGRDGRTREYIYFQNESGEVPRTPVIGPTTDAEQAQIFDPDTNTALTDADFQVIDFVPFTAQSATVPGDPDEYGQWYDELPGASLTKRYIFICARRNTGGHKAIYQPFGKVTLFNYLQQPNRERHCFLPKRETLFYKTGLVWDPTAPVTVARDTDHTMGNWTGTGQLTPARRTPITPGMQKSVTDPLPIPSHLPFELDRRFYFDYNTDGGTRTFATRWYAGQPTEAQIDFAAISQFIIWKTTQDWNEETKQWDPWGAAIISGDTAPDPNAPTESPPSTPGSWVWAIVGGTGQWVDLTKVQSATTTPVPATSVQSSNLRPRGVVLSWSYPTNPTVVPDSFVIERSTTSAFTTVDHTYRAIGATARTTTLTDLAPATAYYFRLRAAKGAIESTPVNWPLITTPAVPVLSLSSRTDRSLTVAWTAVTTPTGSYRLQQKNALGNWVTFYTGTGRSATSRALSKGTDYAFRVYRGTDAAWASDEATFTTSGTATTPPPRPPTPPATQAPTLTLKDATDYDYQNKQGFRSEWTTVSGSGSYEVQWKQASTSTPNTANFDGATNFVTNSFAHNIPVSADADFWVRVRKGTGPWSVAQKHKPNYKQWTIAAGTATETTIPITWTGGTGGATQTNQRYFQIQYREKPNTAWTTKDLTRGATSYTITGLKKGKVYQIAFKGGSSTTPLSGRYRWSTIIEKSTTEALYTLRVSSLRYNSVNVGFLNDGTGTGAFYVERRIGTTGSWATVLPNGRAGLRLTYSVQPVFNLDNAFTYYFRGRRGTTGSWFEVGPITLPYEPPTLRQVAVTSPWNTASFQWSGGDAPWTNWYLHIDGPVDYHWYTGRTYQTTPNLRPNTQYTATLYQQQFASSTNPGTRGPASNVITFTTPHSPPTLAKPATSTNSEMVLNWTPGSLTTGNYEVEYLSVTSTSGVWNTFSSTISGTTTTVTGLSRATTYKFRVRRGTSPWSGEQTQKTSQLFDPYPVNQFRSGTVGNTWATVVYTIQPNIRPPYRPNPQSFYVDISDDHTFSTIRRTFVSFSSSQRFMLLHGLTPNTRYYCRIRVRAGSEHSPYKNIEGGNGSFTTTA